MKKRENIVENFSTFLKFINGSSSLICTWETNRQLANNMQRLCDLDPEAKENFWAQHWLKEVLKENPEPLANLHLSAYLEESCYWAAIKAEKIAKSDFTWMDCFQIARTSATQPRKFLANYKSERNSSIKTYAQLKLTTEILDVVRMGVEKQKYTDAALLRIVTKTFLKNSLKAGIKEQELSAYILAWLCFKEIYTPTKAVGRKGLEWPNSKQLEEIADYYNQLRPSHSLSNPISSKDIDLLLKTCVKAVRDYTSPSVTSLDESDIDIPAPNDEWEEIEPEQSEWYQIKTVLSNAFAALPNNEQKMLELEYGLGITQTDIGKAFKIKQYQVHRQLDRSKRQLLKAVIEWSKKDLNTNLSPEQINLLSTVIDGWLKWYCQSLLHELLRENLLQNLNNEVQVLRFYYGEKLPLQTVATQLAISESRVTEKLEHVTRYLRAKLENQVQTNLPIALNSLNSANKRIISVIDAWIKNAPYATFETEGR